MDEVETLAMEYVLEEDSDFEGLLLSSTTSEDSSDETDSSIENMEVHRRKLVRCRNYVEETVRLYDEREFQDHFKMSRNTLQYMINKITQANILSTHTFGREKVNAEKAFLMTLWYLANQESYRQISDRFDVTKSTAYKIVNMIVEYLVKISASYIVWPHGEAIDEVVDGFYRLQKISGVIGAIDGCHIKILKPAKDQHVYCNRKNDHSILLQGVCDYKKRFIDVFCGEAGSINDARLLKRSKMYEMVSSGHLICENNYLLGDSAYPNLPWIVPPFKDNGNLSENHKTFNYRHSSTRIIIENAFGLLKGRFRRLKSFENLNIKFVSKAVLAACVLHNICINFDDLEVDYDIEINEAENYNVLNDQFEGGFDRRQQLFNEIFCNN